MMGVTRWQDLKHKYGPDRAAEIRREALENYNECDLAGLRKKRLQSQVQLAETLGISQASVSALENHTDVLLGTLARYARALGGELQLAVVFPDGQWQLSSPALIQNEAEVKALLSA